MGRHFLSHGHYASSGFACWIYLHLRTACASFRHWVFFIREYGLKSQIKGYLILYTFSWFADRTQVPRIAALNLELSVRVGRLAYVNLDVRTRCVCRLGQPAAAEADRRDSTSLCYPHHAAAPANWLEEPTVTAWPGKSHG